MIVLLADMSHPYVQIYVLTYILCYIVYTCHIVFIDLLHSYIDMSDFYRDVAFLNEEITHCHIVMQYGLTYRRHSLILG